MKAYDFEYDGIPLHNFGYVICEFDGNGDNTVSNGSEITFNTFKSLHNAADELASTEYENAIGATFQGPQIFRGRRVHKQCFLLSPQQHHQIIYALSELLNRNFPLCPLSRGKAQQINWGKLNFQASCRSVSIPQNTAILQPFPPLPPPHRMERPNL